LEEYKKMSTGNTAETADSATGAASVTSTQKTGTLSTIQLNLTGGAVQNIDQQIVHSTTTKYLAPWFILKVSEKGKDKLEKALKAGDRVGVRNFVVAHMRLRFGKLESGQEGTLYAEGIQLFETMLWKTALGLP
jgi:hypothetical protein